MLVTDAISWTCFRGNTNQAWRFDQNPMVATQFQFGTTGKCLAVQETASESFFRPPVLLPLMGQTATCSASP